MCRAIGRFVAGLVVAACAASGVVLAQAPALDQAGIDRLQRESGGKARVSLHPATGAARFVRLAPVDDARGTKGAAAGERAFFERYGSIFGIRDFGGELRQVSQKSDRLGYRHTAWAQYYRGVPVFAGLLKAHADASGRLYAVNGTFIPGLDLDVTPSRSASDAAAVAIAKVAADKPEATGLKARSSRLVVFREGLVKGVVGPNRLAWEVEVGNGGGVREWVYVDARTGKWVDQYTGVHDALHRRVYDGEYSVPPAAPPNYPDTPFWEEGDPDPPTTATCVQQGPLPCNVEADNVILATKETYDLFNLAFARDSIDGAGLEMDGIFDRAFASPNAQWTGTFTHYSPGVTGDDTVAHEWGHAYTQYTHNLIYAWQSGALNESYSDIWGEVVDFINGRGTDTPGGPRTVGECSQFGGTPPPELTITGGTAAGTYFAIASVNEPTPPVTVGPAAMAVTSPVGACTPVASLTGQVAIIDWTLLPGGANECGSAARANNALAAGAVGIIFIAPPAGLLNLGSVATIASVQVTNADGQTIKNGLPASATISLDIGTDNSYRWLSSEDDPGFGGAIRDMWNPNCFGDPARVAAGFYSCSAADSGGVHTNSGVPNHGFALLVDGGTYNGQTVAGIGMTKAAHIYFRAMDQYQVSVSDFADHADALETSCEDLRVLATDLPSLTTGAPSGEVIGASDCAQLALAIDAVELRAPLTFCNFQPLLAPNPPDRCSAGLTQENLFLETFENTGRRRRPWATSEVAVVPADFTPRSWERVTGLPGGRPGYALYGPNPDIGTCAPGGDESGVLRATSPQFRLTGTGPYLITFDHWVATEPGWDGGLLEVSVNGGAWTQVPAANFTFNAYNAVLQTVGAGNTNPLAGRAAFNGTDGGSNGGSWGRSHANLTGLAVAGDRVRLRLNLGSDGCTGRVGWIVDDVTVYRCVP